MLGVEVCEKNFPVEPRRTNGFPRFGRYLRGRADVFWELCFERLSREASYEDP